MVWLAVCHGSQLHFVFILPSAFGVQTVSVYVQLLLLSSGRDCMRFCGLSLACRFLTATASPGKHVSGK